MVKYVLPGTSPIPSASTAKTQLAYVSNAPFVEPETGNLSISGQHFISQQIIPAIKSASGVTSFTFESANGIQGQAETVDGAVSLELALENIAPTAIDCSGQIIAENFVGSGAGLTNIPISAISNFNTASTSNNIPYQGLWYDTTNLIYETTLSYNLASTSLTISPLTSTTPYRVWVGGNLYYFSTPQKVVHNATQGIWYIYYNSQGILTASQTVWDILAIAPVALIYYDATTPDYILFDERHHFDTPVEWHQSQHFAIGTFIKLPATDFVLGSYTLGTDSDAAVQWSLSSGTAVDEDIENVIPALPAAGPYQVIYKSGSAGNFERIPNTTVPYTYSPGGYIYYNQYTGGSWQLTALTSNNRINYYVFGTTGYETGKQILIVPGQQTYSSLASAQAEDVTALNLTGFPTLEFVPLYQITFHTLGGYSHTGKCEIEGVQKIFGTHVGLSLATPTFTNPMTTLGDIIVGDVGGAPSRLAIGNGILLGGSTPTWTMTPTLTSVTATTFTGALTGASTSCSGNAATATTAGTVTTGAQSLITSVGTLTGLTVVNSTNYPASFKLSGGITCYMYSDAGGSGIANSNPYSSGALLYLTGSSFQFYNGASYATSITSSGLTTPSITTSGSYGRSVAGTGYLNGNYGSIETGTTTGPIYCIGPGYAPTSTTLGTMYGIGYGYSNSVTALLPSNGAACGWGIYGASAGTSHFFISTDNGNAYFAGAIVASNLSGTNTGDQTNISGNAATVTQNSYSSTGSYDINWTTGTGGSTYFTPGISITPNTGTITATTFNGTVATATNATELGGVAASSYNQISTTISGNLYSGSRIAGTNYTNSTGRILIVYLIVSNSPSNGYTLVTIGGNYIMSFNNYGNTGGGCFPVPPGKTYNVNVSGSTITAWYEC